MYSATELLAQIHKTKITLRIGYTTGMKTTNMRGHLSGYEWRRFYPGGISNILSMSRTRERYRVTFDSVMDNCFCVHKSNGKIL
jgi:hypothetical protein